MGWWHTRGGNIIGDSVSDLMEYTLGEIRQAYKEQLGRDATQGDLEDLFSFAMLDADERPKTPGRRVLATRHDYLARYPRICAHIIAESLGYATPSTAAMILKDAREGNENWCEWIFSCYNRDPKPAVEGAIRGRHRHRGYMAEYRRALAIVRRQVETGQAPEFASWF